MCLSRIPSRATTRAAALLALLLLPAGPSRAAAPSPPEISFTVRTLKEENVEGPDVERTYFAAGDKKIVFGQPKGCRLTFDDAGLLILLSEVKLDGEIHVTRSPFTPETDLAANALQYRDEAARTMPAGASDIVVLPPVMHPYPFNGWKSLGFTWTYTVAGRPMVRTVSYLNLEIGTQITVTTLASKKDDEKVRGLARQFMNSWWVKAR